MKKAVKIIIVIFVCAVFGMVLLEYALPPVYGNFNITDAMWEEMQENAKVNIKKTFKGTVDDVLDEYYSFRYVESDESVEFNAITHKIFGIEENRKVIKCYVSYGHEECSFVNGYFECVGGCSPVVVKLKKIANNEYKVISYLVPYEGHLRRPSLERMFPKDILDEYLDGKYVKDLKQILNKKEQKYLKKIGKKAEIKDNVQREWLLEDMDDDDMNQAEIDKIYYLIEKFIDRDYPDWIGT